MAKKRFYDVWFVRANTVYREVPYNVVADWVQQGRLQPEDRVRPAGAPDWHELAGFEALNAYLPVAAPTRIGDHAEALEPVELDTGWRPSSEAEDEDVDMIPLIDISLVLLVFFMMTTTVAALSHINVPETKHTAETTDNPEAFWLGIDRDLNGTPLYAISRGTRAPSAEDSGLTESELLARFDERIRQETRAVEVRVAAHREVPVELVHQLTYQLEQRRRSGVQIEQIVAEVNELP
ncbi:MAG TPA: biopolymer transporter ExbD, partial [Gemmataceae bacterium]